MFIGRQKLYSGQRDIVKDKGKKRSSKHNWWDEIEDCTTDGETYWKNSSAVNGIYHIARKLKKK